MKFLRKTEVKLFFTIFLVYLFFLSDYGGNWMADSIIDSAMAFVDTGEFIVDNYIKGPQDNAFFKGHHYSGFAPGASFLVMPLYLIFKPLMNIFLPTLLFNYSQIQIKVILMNIIATIFLTIPSSTLLSVLLYRFLGYFTENKKDKIWISLFFSFGTLIFVYSTGYYRRPIAILLCFLAFYLLYKMKHQHLLITPQLLFLIGFILGFAVFIEYTMFILVGFMCLYLLTFMRTKKLLWFIIGIIIPLILLLTYHYYIFEDPFTTPYMHRASPRAQSITSLSDVFNNLPTSETIFGVTFSFERGIFIYSPIILFSFIGIILFFKGRQKKHFTEMIIITLIAFSYIIFNASQLDIWSAGCSFGPRFLMPALPFLMIPLVYSFRRINKKVIVSIGLVSIFINLLSDVYGITGLWRGICTSRNPLKEYLLLIPERGLTNYTINLINERLATLSILKINLLALTWVLVLFFVIRKIWKSPSV